ncbi:hypothetical protein BB560_003443 [Smittium megazygosporum]|uniref:Peptide hydrolase n=1 Tax=Smittium megazygosporum TaxID=133381 RepID=A0A2T9ZBY9_9FUNG|nr:hypothetical protein BB560_003443 [Smittium megazygosporum]
MPIYNTRFRKQPTSETHYPSSSNSKSKTKPSYLSMIKPYWRSMVVLSGILFLLVFSLSSGAKERGVQNQNPHLETISQNNVKGLKENPINQKTNMEEQADLKDFKVTVTNLDTLDFTSKLDSDWYKSIYAKADAIKQDYNVSTGELLAPLLVERVVGTQGYYDVQRFLVDKLKEFNFDVSFDNFTSNTPMGEKSFSNIIGIRNPKSTKRLVLAAHYDSKIFPGEKFIGATDSSVPMALILGVCKTLSSLMDNSERGLQIIFFDGEEAFINWSGTDSLYGSKNLAQKWSKSLDPISANALPNLKANELDLVEVFVLLDLIGTSDNQFVPLEATTLQVFNQIADIEKNLLERKYVSKTYFLKSSSASWQHIEDDHIPFVKLGVRALHLISTPFPWSWHTLDDNPKSLSSETIENLNTVMIAFVASYLNLPV